MAGIWGISTILLVLLLFLHYLKFLWSSRNYPPGPFPLPFIGGYWKMWSPFSQDVLKKLAEQYGNIYTIWIGYYPVVILSGYQAVKEGLINHSEDFALRPVTPFLKAVFNKRGILTSNGHIWKQQRRFGKITLRKLGMGGKSLENIIQNEARCLMEVFAHGKDQPFDPSLPITNGVSNVIKAVVFGNHVFPENEQFHEIVNSCHFVQTMFGTYFHILYEIAPALMNYLPGAHKKVFFKMEELKSALKNIIENCKQHQFQDEPEDFTEYYQLQIKNSKDDPNSTYNEQNLIQCICDLIGAGTETTVSCLKWGLLLMAHHPDIQEKVYKELDEVLGSSPFIYYQDRKNLPYTQAVVHEILRARYILPIGIPRSCAKDVEMFGFTIPKWTFIMVDLLSLLLDPEKWETPKEFNPSHFLDEDGQFVVREHFLPFGAGIRVCIGEQLAKMEMFLFLAYILRAFHIEPAGTNDQLNNESSLGFTIHPNPFKIHAISRSNLS